jgi:hypothetical protein
VTALHFDVKRGTARKRSHRITIPKSEFLAWKQKTAPTLLPAPI